MWYSHISKVRFGGGSVVHWIIIPQMELQTIGLSFVNIRTFIQNFHRSNMEGFYILSPQKKQKTKTYKYKPNCWSKLCPTDGLLPKTTEVMLNNGLYKVLV